MPDTAATTSAGLAIKMVDKPWGVAELPTPFTGKGGGEKIGEIWFEPPPELPELLVKYIFTSEALSVQVHPSDAETLADGLGRQGKEECWVVIDAKPGAQLGIGLTAPSDKATLRAAALDGSIEAMLAWHPVRRGDFFYIPAGTIHAIGAGIGVIETQQNSDITYRLYDYGRGRELHLDKGMAVAKPEPYDLTQWHRHVDLDAAPMGGVEMLVPGPLFRLARVSGTADTAALGAFTGAPLLAIPITGTVDVAARGEHVVAGGAALVPDIAALRCDPAGVYLLAQAIPQG